ncbi:MAG: hypothetical protein ACLFVO_22225 [Chloroflexaceae bacterium]
MKAFSPRILLLTILLVVGAAGAIVLSHTIASAQDPHQTMLTLRDLPENAVVSSDGYIRDFTEISHPLHKAEPLDSADTQVEKSADLYDYSSVYMFSSLLREQKAYVANWQYVYQNPEQAQKAAELFLHQAVNQAPDKIERYPGTSKNKALTGEILSVVNPEDGVEVFWFVATDGNILSLAMVDGLESEANKEVLRTIFDMQEN